MSHSGQLALTSSAITCDASRKSVVELPSPGLSTGSVNANQCIVGTLVGGLSALNRMLPYGKNKAPHVTPRGSFFRSAPAIYQRPQKRFASIRHASVTVFVL
eukprot:scaffold86693_cov60-Phaeocystis_antarctica.AAC.3